MTTRSSEAVDPDGVGWTVRRRWYPWRRVLSLRDLVATTPTGEKGQPTESEDTESEGTESDTESEGTESEDTELPRNVVLRVGFVALAAVVWVVFGAAKVLFYAVVVVLFLVGSLLELAVALTVMPVTLLMRLLGRSRWPVEIARGGEHFDTRQAADFASAGELRDALLTDIGRGVLPVDARASTE